MTAVARGGDDVLQGQPLDWAEIEPWPDPVDGAVLLDESERAAPTSKKDDYRPVIPVPEDAPAPDWRKLQPKEATGDPVETWPYHTAAGGVGKRRCHWGCGPPFV